MGTILKYNISETLEHFDKAFSPGGQWEANRGCDQTRRFTECFVRNIKIPFDEFSLLDVGCAPSDCSLCFMRGLSKGKNLWMWRAELAIARCEQDYGYIAEIFKAGFEDIASF